MPSRVRTFATGNVPRAQGAGWEVSIIDVDTTATTRSQDLAATELPWATGREGAHVAARRLGGHECVLLSAAVSAPLEAVRCSARSV